MVVVITSDENILIASVKAMQVDNIRDYFRVCRWRCDDSETRAEHSNTLIVCI